MIPRRSWTAAEMDDLEACVALGLATKVIATLFNRSEDAIRSRRRISVQRARRGDPREATGRTMITGPRPRPNDNDKHLRLIFAARPSGYPWRDLPAKYRVAA
jgi:hypothetical protein